MLHNPSSVNHLSRGSGIIKLSGTVYATLYEHRGLQDMVGFIFLAEGVQWERIRTEPNIG
jgi:hypothetical protein